MEGERLVGSKNRTHRFPDQKIKGLRSANITCGDESWRAYDASYDQLCADHFPVYDP